MRLLGVVWVILMTIVREFVDSRDFWGTISSDFVDSSSVEIMGYNR